MQQTWKIRFLLVALSFAVAVYVLIPTFVYFSLNPEQLREVRSNKEAFSKYLPSWASHGHIVPGLDLQGGIHLVLGVDIEKALSDRMNRTADRLSDFAKSKNIAFDKIAYNAAEEGLGHIVVDFKQEADVKKFKADALSQYGELIVAGETANELKLSLDPNLIQTTKRDAVDQTINTIRTRIDKMGVTEPSISKRGEDQIQIQLPGYDDPAAAKNMIGRTAQLEFQMADDDTEFLTQLTDLPKDVELVKSGYSRPNGTTGKDYYLQFAANKLDEVKTYLKGKVPSENVVKFGRESNGHIRTYTLVKRSDLTGDDLVDARVSLGSTEDPRPGVSMTFSPSGGRIFAALTEKSIGKRMAIVLEDTIDSAPIINVAIPNGQASISMGGSRTRELMMQDANQLALVLKSGALPAPVTFREERSVGPSLGADSVADGFKAFAVGGLLVILFMVFYYRLSGMFSVIGVTLNVLFTLATMALMGATITLPGIAGLLLTIGMAVDANIIINERIREELRAGKMPSSAVKVGYSAAFTAVFDAHFTTFLAGLVLWQFGTGPVQNFATMLIIGNIWSIVTAVFMTRVFFDGLTANNPQTISI